MSKSNFINKVFGHYNLIVQIAEGTLSDVYLALPINDSQHKVVVKVLRSVHLTSRQERDSFLQETQFLTQLKHPYILPIIDIGVEKGMPYVVTEYTPHGSLRDHLEEMSLAHMSRQEKLQVLSQVGQALNYVHEHNILHCNIKPENILFNEKKEALLADFGLASILEATGAKSRSYSDALYKAPEQLKGVVSKESDQHALGCIAYELFSEQAPLKDKKRIKQHMNAGMSFPFDFPQYMCEAIVKATAKNPNERHANVLAFINALNNVQSPSSAYKLSQKPLTDADAVLPIPTFAGAGIGSSIFPMIDPEVALASTETYKNQAQDQPRKRLPASVKLLGFAFSGLTILAIIFSFLTPFNPLAAPLTTLRLTTGTATASPTRSASGGNRTALLFPRIVATPTPTPQPTPSFQPLLQANMLSSPNAVNLTTEGAIDWAQWGLHSASDFNQKSGVPQGISFTVLGNAQIQDHQNHNTNYTWSDGIPTMSASTSAGVYVNGENNGFSLTLPASTTKRILRVYVNVYQARGQFTASLDGSNLPVYQNSSLNSRDGSDSGVYNIVYSAASANETLTIKFTILNSHSSGGAVDLQAVTVQ